MPAESFGDGARRARAEERIENRVARFGGCHDHAMEQRLRLLCRMRLLAGFVLQTLMAGADRHRPVRAHLQFVVQRLHRFVIEGVALLVARLGGPDHRLMRVGEAFAPEVRHRVRLAPDDVVQDPEAQVLQDRADAEDVVIGADDPQAAGVFQHVAGGREPVAGEAVVVGKARELVPFVIAGIDFGIVGTAQFAFELEVIGRVGKDEVDRPLRQPAHVFDAIAFDDAVACIVQFEKSGHVPPRSSTERGRVSLRSPQVKSLSESKR